MKEKLLEVIKVTGLPVLFASLCCLSPVVLFMLGLVSAAVAGDLADIFYGRYKWVFRSIGLIALIVAYVVYLRGRGICTFDEAKKKRTEIINKFLLLLAAGIIVYTFFLYVVVHYIGVFLKIWQ